jgi:hypothetical protein
MNHNGVPSGEEPQAGLGCSVAASFLPSILGYWVLDLGILPSHILKLVAGGFANKEIAEQLDLSVDTVCWYLKGIYRKLHVHSRTQAALRYRKLT